MAIKTHNAGTITNLETGETAPLVAYEAETPADLAALLGMDMDELTDLQERAELENWG